jgi:hypothetical protein
VGPSHLPERRYALFFAWHERVDIHWHREADVELQSVSA